MKLKEKLLFLLLISTMLLSCFSPTALALTDGEWEYKILNNEVTITGYSGTDENIVVPSSIVGKTVTRVEAKDILKNTTSITFPEGVKVIDIAPTVRNAVDKNEKLVSVILPNSLEEIGRAAFAYSPNLTDIKIPSNIKKIGGAAFAETGLVSIDLSNINADIGGGLFSGCKDLKNVKLSDMSAIPSKTFNSCSSLKKIDLPHTINKIGSFAFSGCSSLEQVILPTNLTQIGGYAFSECVNLSEVFLPYGVEELQNDVFTGCSNLKALYMPSTIRNIIARISSQTPNCIIYCVKNSFCESFCSEKEISYIVDNSVDSKINVLYNDSRISFNEYNQNPEIIDGRTLVPLRAIFEAMKADIEWDGNTNTVTAKRGNVTISIQIGADVMFKNGVDIAVDVPAQLINGRTMIPVRVIAESFGADVQWNGNGNVVLITE